MKRILLILFTCFIGTQMMNAQEILQEGNLTPETKKLIKKKTKMLAKKLELTGEQRAVMKNKITQFYMQKKELLSYDMNKKDFQKRMAALKNYKIAEIQNILRDYQLKVYTQMIETGKITTIAEMREK